ncbi:hypothetical protein Syun_031209 [Stephania yunnanensis]|uniref:BPL/LPL catalytic domain-containing protein n=1 Tax=Stephania yunnanensis TaxID=152371 RepID=A0AAP0HB58_9MAGN
MGFTVVFVCERVWLDFDFAIAQLNWMDFEHIRVVWSLNSGVLFSYVILPVFAMRKLFFFRSSAPSNGGGSSVPPPQPLDDEKVFWDMPSENGGNGQGGQRSERNLLSSSDLGESQYNCSADIPPQVSDYPARCLSLTPEKHAKSKRGEVGQMTASGVEELDSPCSSRRCRGSSESTSHSTTPVPLRCGSARLAHVSNKVLDLYIDGEQHEDRRNLKPKTSSFKTSSANENVKGWRPPRVRSTAPGSPTGLSEERPRSKSFREVKETHFSTRNLMRNKLGHENPQELAKSVVERLSEESVTQDSGFSVSELLQTIRDLSEERKQLALDVLAQLHFRIAERTSSKEALRFARDEFDSRAQRSEKEKNELRLVLEKELDRRSNDSSFKLGKCHLEEQRLRDRVRELAEQNVSLQREVSSLKGREVESSSRTVHLEQQLKEMTDRLQEANKENQDLQQSVSELQEQYKGAATDMDCMRSSYKNKENENRELQKVVVRLQRTCSEQEKSINGLRQGLNEEIGKMSPTGNHDDHMHKLQMEQMRLTGVEQVLRKEVETYRIELESLRHENINLLGRLQSIGSDGGSSFYKLDQELHARVDYLQNQGLSLMNESKLLCEKLLEFIKQNRNQLTDNVPSVDNDTQEARRNGLNGYFMLESDMKIQNLKKGLENLTRSLKMGSAVLNEKAKLISEFQSQCTPNDGSRKLTGQASEVDVDLRLKEEILVTSLLREKQFSKQLEVDQLQAELATTVMGQEILRHEVQGALDALSCVSHKMKDLELQMLRKDESIKQLRNDLQECSKELIFTKDILGKVSEERDLMWEKVKKYSEENMLLKSELKSEKKKKEELEEQVLVKDGQLAMLTESLRNEPFSILYQPDSIVNSSTGVRVERGCAILFVKLSAASFCVFNGNSSLMFIFFGMLTVAMDLDLKEMMIGFSLTFKSAMRIHRSLEVWKMGFVNYLEALKLQEKLAGDRKMGNIPDTLLALQHPPTYTLGKRKTSHNLLVSEEEVQHMGAVLHYTERR